MTDQRIERLGELIVGYSLGLRPGETVRIDVPVVATPLGLAIAQAALRVGARPILAAKLPELEELLLREGSDEQLGWTSPIAACELAEVDAAVTIWAETNTRSRSRLALAVVRARPLRRGRVVQRLVQA